MHVFICSFTVHKPLLSIDNLLLWLSKLRLDRRSLKCFVLCHFCHVINFIIVEVEVLVETKIQILNSAEHEQVVCGLRSAYGDSSMSEYICSFSSFPDLNAFDRLI